MAEENPRNPALGIALLMIGLVILIPSGLCTGVFGGGALLDAFLNPSSGMDSGGMLALALIIGGPFVLLGAFLVRLGIHRLRAK